MAGPISLDEQLKKAAPDARWSSQAKETRPAPPGVGAGPLRPAGPTDAPAPAPMFGGPFAPLRNAGPQSATAGPAPLARPREERTLGDPAALRMYSAWLDAQGPRRSPRGPDRAPGPAAMSDQAAAASLNLAGPSLDLGPRHLRAGDWTQAAGGVELSNGAASLLHGGEAGGAHVGLAHGQLDLSLGGPRTGAAGGARPAASWLGHGAAAGQPAGAGPDYGQGVGPGLGQDLSNGWNGPGPHRPRWL